MAGKYNTRHDQRSQSRYPERLRKRGLSNVDVRMESLESLRRRQGRRADVGAEWLDALYAEEPFG